MEDKKLTLADEVEELCRRYPNVVRIVSLILVIIAFIQVYRYLVQVERKCVQANERLVYCKSECEKILFNSTLNEVNENDNIPFNWKRLIKNGTE